MRACAALAVVAYHLDVLPVGWAGVWLFFVLSGFVITRILVTSGWTLSLASYGSFMRRRIARIWPLYFLFAFVALSLELMLGHYAGLWQVAFGIVTFTYNFQDPFHLDPTFYGRLWTISVEQQFYLFFPLVLGLPCSVGRHWFASGSSRMACTFGTRW